MEYYEKKANEISVKMLYAINTNPTIKELFGTEAAECALVCVDEIIEMLKSDWGDNQWRAMEYIEEWEKVKAEINKLIENNQESEQLNILAVRGSAFTVTPPNVVLDTGSAKIVFDKQQIYVDDMLDVYIKLKNYLNTFNGVYL